MLKESDNLLEKQKKFFMLLGVSVYEGQCIEHKLKTLIEFIPLPHDEFHLAKEYFVSRRTLVEKRPLGFVINELKKRAVSLSNDAENLVDKFLEQRNTVVHELVKLPNFNLNIEEGIHKGMQFLDEYRKTIQAINGIFDPILISALVLLCENANIDDIDLYQEKLNNLDLLFNESLTRAGGSLEIEVHNNLDERFDCLIKSKSNLSKDDSSALNSQEEKKKLWQHTKIIQALSRIVADIANQDGWVDLPVCEQQLKTEYPEIKPDNYGFKNIQEIIKICNLFELQEIKQETKYKVYFRFNQERDENE